VILLRYLSKFQDAVHKVLTYVEYRAVSDVFQNIYYLPYTPSPPSECVPSPPPAPRAGGTHSQGGEGDGGSIFWETPAIGLASSNNLSTKQPLELIAHQWGSCSDWAESCCTSPGWFPESPETKFLFFFK
jgi:hypothetical protein